jgi:hypothetical protein
MEFSITAMKKLAADGYYVHIQFHEKHQTRELLCLSQLLTLFFAPFVKAFHTCLHRKGRCLNPAYCRSFETTPFDR